LRGEVGPGQAVEGCGQAGRRGGWHGKNPWRICFSSHCPARGRSNPPVSRQASLQESSTGAGSARLPATGPDERRTNWQFGPL